jgi:hypothetical protein
MKPEITENDKQVIVGEAIKAASKIMMLAYKACDMKVGIETTVIEPDMKMAFHFSFKIADYETEKNKPAISLPSPPKP